MGTWLSSWLVAGRNDRDCSCKQTSRSVRCQPATIDRNRSSASCIERLFFPAIRGIRFRPSSGDHRPVWHSRSWQSTQQLVTTGRLSPAMPRRLRPPEMQGAIQRIGLSLNGVLSRNQPPSGVAPLQLFGTAAGCCVCPDDCHASICCRP